MAWGNVGPWTYLTGGQSAYWWYDFGGANLGIQSAGADIKVPNNQTPRHNAFDQGRAISNSGYVQYFVTIKNVGPATSNCWHNLAGGGVV